MSKKKTHEQFLEELKDKNKNFENALFNFRDFMGIAPKNFEADIFYVHSRLLTFRIDVICSSFF